MSKKNYYYNVQEDVYDFPDCWLYITIGGRNTGKTYGALKSCIINDRNFVFVKRTNEDVKLLCAGSGRIGTKQNEFGVDLSPFVSLNRDMGWNIKAFTIKEGLGGFWKCDDENNPIGSPVGYIISLNYIQKIKGFDLSFCDWIIFDEFIPQPWEKVSRSEGYMVMDLYKTVSRDREHRGKEALKLICLANATNASNPLCNTVEITDDVVEMKLEGIPVNYIDDRAILIHLLDDNQEFKEVEEQSLIYKAMKNTSWGQMALNNEFAYNDFSNVSKKNLKGHKPVCSVKHKNTTYYIYQREGIYYMTFTKGNPLRQYDLNLENDQKRFYREELYDLEEVCIDGRFSFETYTMYDLIMNYKDFYRV